MDLRQKIKAFPYAATLLFEAAGPALFLLYFDKNGYTAIMQAKAAAFFLLCGAYLLTMALWAALRLLVLGPPPLPRPKLPQVLMGAFLGLTWLSALCSPYFPATLLGTSRYEGALTVTLYGLCFLLISLYGRLDRRLLWVLGIALSLFSLLCLCQLFGNNPFGLYPAGYNYYDGGISYKAGAAYLGAYLGTIGNVDMVAGVYSLCIPLMVFALLRLKGAKRWGLLVPLGLSLWVLAWMDVAAGLLGALGGCVLAFPVAGLTKRSHKKWAGLALLGLAGLGLLAVYLVDFGGLAGEAHRVLHGELSESLGTGRLFIWRQVLEKVPEHLWLGAGPDTMLYGGLEPFTHGALTARIDTAHNLYLNILYHQGLPALLAYVSLLGVLALRWARAAGESPAAAILGAGCLGWAIQAFFAVGMGGIELPFWVALGLLCLRQDLGALPQTPQTLLKKGLILKPTRPI